MEFSLERENIIGDQLEYFEGLAGWSKFYVLYLRLYLEELAIKGNQASKEYSFQILSNLTPDRA